MNFYVITNTTPSATPTLVAAGPFDRNEAWEMFRVMPEADQNEATVARAGSPERAIAKIRGLF